MVWSHNTAGMDAGAVYMHDSSDVSWSGEMTWSYNTAGEDAGELGPGSTVPAYYAGGAVYMYRYRIMGRRNDVVSQQQRYLAWRSSCRV